MRSRFFRGDFVQHTCDSRSQYKGRPAYGVGDGMDQEFAMVPFFDFAGKMAQIFANAHPYNHGPTASGKTTTFQRLNF